MKCSKQEIDQIPIELVKNSHDHFLGSICEIINLCFTESKFPSSQKIAKIIPLHKKNDKYSVSNYRPISILPFLGKIIEKCIFSRLISFIKNHELLSSAQFGFIKGSSTEDAVLKMCDYIYEALNNKNFGIGTFVDLCKAFDTVSHPVLLRKLERYGCRGGPLALLRNFLSNRHQYVQIQNKFSSKKPVQIGLPQGSSLSPILFLLYINDLPSISSDLKYVLFADDTSLFLSDPSYDNLIRRFNTALELFNQWCIANRLSVNVDKTHYMHFTNRSSLLNYGQLSLNSSLLSSTSKTLFLGVTLDNSMKFNSHIDIISSKISKSIGIIFKLAPFLPTRTLINLYYSLIYPYFIYCNLVWGGTYSTHLDPLLKLQKKALRIINKKPFLHPTNELFFNNSILKLPDIHIFRMGIYMFSNNSFRSNFERSHDHNTRNSFLLLPSHQRLNSTIRSTSSRGVRIWNSIPVNIQESPSVPIFKSRFKKFLVEKYNPVFLSYAE